MVKWLEWLETESGTGAHSVVLWVGIFTLAFLVVLALARIVQAATGVTLLDFGSRKKSAGARRGAAPIPGGHEKILVVDDEPAVRETTVRCLSELGYRVVSVDSGEAAVN